MSQITRLKPVQNKSGISPSANRVLVKPDEIENQVTSSNIVIPDAVLMKYQQGQASGTLIAVGPDAFCHVIERTYRIHGNRRELVEESVRGYSQPFADVGDRIAFAKYSGLRVKGEDGANYVILNDEDITARVSDGVEFTDLDTRKGVGLRSEQ